MTRRKKIPDFIRENVYKRFHGRCAYCGKKITLKEMQVDHVQSVYQGGADSLDNYRASCRACNYYKGGGDQEYLRTQISQTVHRLTERNFIFRMALAYGLISIHEKPIVFDFEK